MTREYRPLGVAALLLPVVLSGCGVPGSGDAMVVEEVTHGDEGRSSSSETNPPSPSTDALTTVTNFLQAAAGDPNSRDDRLDRFVTDDVDWSDPGSGLQIVRLSQEPRLSGEDGLTEATVIVTGEIVGVYGQQGQVLDPSGSADYDEEFRLERPNPDARWQLVDPPRQVTLDDGAFSDNYEPRPLYFPARGDAGGLLVPDLRWMSDTVSDDATMYSQLADWLMQGPSDWIGATVTSGFPAGMTRRSSVEVDGDSVTIDVSTENATGKADQYDTMSAQLSWSLGLGEDLDLTLLVDGQERMAAAVSEWSNRSRAPASTEDPGSRDLIYFIDDDQVRAADSDAPFVGETADGMREAVLEPRGSRMAAVVGAPTGLMLMVGPVGRLERVEDFTAATLSDPQWLDKDLLLVLADGKPTVVNVETGTSRTISASSLGESPHSFALAPDARRLAYVSGGRAWVVPVTHVDDKQAPISFGERRRVGSNITSVDDVGWSQETQLLIVGEVPDEQEWLWRVSLDNASQDEMEGTVGSSVTKADKLAVRCNPPKRGDSVGQPVVVEIDGNILRVYGSQVQQVTVEDDEGEAVEATGHDPFVAT